MAARPLWMHVAVMRIFDSMPRVRQLRRKAGELAGDDTVLEVGCGLGANAPYCRGRYIGLDPREPVIDIARRRHPDKEFIAGDLDGAELPDELDVVLLMLTVHEMHDRDATLRRIAELPLKRIVVIDYDATMNDWSRFWTQFNEPVPMEPYWQLDLIEFFAALGWRGTTGKINRLFNWWEFTRDDA